MMRVQSLVTGSVLGGAFKGGATAVTQPVGNFASSQAEKFRQGSADAQQQFEEGARQAEQDVGVWRHSARAAAIRGAGHSLGMVEVLLGTQDMHREVISASHLLAFKQQA